jgi:regulator of protease activity HflC (stomatin/prohibitin superfamily)
MQTRESHASTANGWGAFGLLFLLSLALAFTEYYVIRNLVETRVTANVLWVVLVSVVSLVCLACWFGFYTLQPNQGAVLVLFGAYRGTDRASGLRWANPLPIKIKVSLRARNLNMQPIKVNDLRGNPIEIAAVVVWRVADTAQAVFDVDKYEHYVSVQSEAALRHLASAYPYDTTEHEQLSLRGSMDEVSAGLQNELHERLGKAGVVVDEARLSHLAYAPEIAGAMLQRQQAEAVVAARTRIVDGAVGIVEMALDKLEKSQRVTLDEERKAAMVNNLLVVLCGDKSAHPVVNAGTLYT